jgi:predicted anti-sigma-YlaC factor YlaD
MKRRLVILLIAAFASSACSVRRFAINKIGDALAEGGSTYQSDEDIDLVQSALPFGLKLIESLLAESPRHKGLLLAASQGFASYAYIDVQQQLDTAAGVDLRIAESLRPRARRLYLRGHAYGLSALEIAHPGFEREFSRQPREAVKVLRKEEVPVAYWAAASLGLAISVSKDDVSLLARIPEVEALLDRSLEIDPGWNNGALHEFSVVMAGAKPGKLDVDKISKHFTQALELSKGRNATLFVSYAEAVSVPQQNRDEFIRFLDKALAVDPDSYKEIRLLNLVAQRRARWLLQRIDDLILNSQASAGGGRR